MSIDLIERSKDVEVQYGTIESVGLTTVTVTVASAKTPLKMKKPADFSGGRGDSCSITRNPRTLLWELVEVRRNSAPESATPTYTQPGYVIIQDWTTPPATISFDIPFSVVPTQFQNAIIEIQNPRTSVAGRNVTFSGYDAGSVARSGLVLTLAAVSSVDLWVGFIRAESFSFRASNGGQSMNEVVYSNRTAGSEVVRTFNRFNGTTNAHIGWRFELSGDVWHSASRYRILGF